jgi:hypothetical protein
MAHTHVIQICTKAAVSRRSIRLHRADDRRLAIAGQEALVHTGVSLRPFDGPTHSATLGG